MVSEIQLIANRQNAKKGGVKTEEGKAVVRFNALKHGLLSQRVVLPGEDQHAFDELSESFIAALQPEGPFEYILVDIIVSTYWRMARVVTLEACFFGSVCTVEDYNRVVLYRFNDGRIANLHRHESSMERRFLKSLHESERLQMARKGHVVPAPMAVAVDVSHEG